MYVAYVLIDIRASLWPLARQCAVLLRLPVSGGGAAMRYEKKAREAFRPWLGGVILDGITGRGVVEKPGRLCRNA